MGTQTSNMAEMASVMANIVLDELQWQDYASDSRPEVGGRILGPVTGVMQA